MLDDAAQGAADPAGLGDLGQQLLPGDVGHAADGAHRAGADRDQPNGEHDGKGQQEAGATAEEDQHRLHAHVRTVIPSASDSR